MTDTRRWRRELWIAECDPGTGRPRRQTGDFEQNWRGYFIPDTDVLRNRVGAETIQALRDAENDLVEPRIIELRQSPGILGDRTYHLAYLQAIHRQLFQDANASRPASDEAGMRRRPCASST
jgi:hypothetical protein